MTEQDLKPLTSTFLERLIEREKKFGVVPAEQLPTPKDRALQYERFEKMVGDTPLILVCQAHATTGNTNIWAKVESENPTESHYDRATVVVLKRLEQEGLLKPGDTILEGTSGSAGRSFAYF